MVAADCRSPQQPLPGSWTSRHRGAGNRAGRRGRTRRSATGVPRASRETSPSFHPPPECPPSRSASAAALWAFTAHRGSKTPRGACGPPRSGHVGSRSEEAVAPHHEAAGGAGRATEVPGDIDSIRHRNGVAGTRSRPWRSAPRSRPRGSPGVGRGNPPHGLGHTCTAGHTLGRHPGRSQTGSRCLAAPGRDRGRWHAGRPGPKKPPWSGTSPWRTLRRSDLASRRHAGVRHR